MIETNTKTGERKVFCDICSKELTDKLIIFNSGAIQCEKCFTNDYKIINVDEFLSKFINE